MNRLRPLVLVALTLASLAVPAAARASAGFARLQQDVEMPLFPVQRLTDVPPGLHVDAARALAVAKTSAALRAIHRREHPLTYQIEAWYGRHYEIFFFRRGAPVADVIVEPDGRLGPTWTGPLVQGLYGRGHYSKLFDSPAVWVTFGVLFLLPFVPWRRRPSLRLLDLAAILSFGVSYSLFDRTHLAAAVWLAYPPLLYLLARMVALVFRRSDAGLSSWMGDRWLALGVVGLLGARAALNLASHQVIDVGVASEIGAYRVLHGLPMYYASLGHPDTYGPINYLAYVPFEAIWPWRGTWNELTAAHAAAIAFDLVTAAALFSLGRRIRPGRSGRRLGLKLAWMWAACPFTLLGVLTSTNDGLVALLVALMLLTLSSGALRGGLLGAAAAAKFVPALLLGIVAVGPGAVGRRGTRAALVSAFLVAGGAVALFLPPGGIQEMWDHTLGFQLSRSDVFSVWALHPALAPLKDAVMAGAVALAVLLSLRPRGVRSTAQVAAATAAVLIAVQLPAQHWFYFYLVWFLPCALVAIVAGERSATLPSLAALEPAAVTADVTPVSTPMEVPV